LRTQSASTPGTTTITHSVTVAAGVFAPGHLGELTQHLPFELVDDVLERTRTVQRRLRDLPSRTGVYFLLALGMFPRLGYARVWAKLTAGLTGIAVACPSEKALRDLRRRLGPAPMKALFEVVAGPLAQPRTPGTCFAGLRTVAFDGCNSLKVPDTDRNRSWMGRIRYRMGFAGYPTLRLMTLAETGTRGLIGAVIGSAADRDEANRCEMPRTWTYGRHRVGRDTFQRWVRRRNSQAAKTNEQVSRPTHQASAIQPVLPIEVPVSRPRTVSITGVIGWFSLTACRNDGMVFVGTKALLR
jgi:hypothetical protein